MANVFSQIYLHVVFAVKHRRALLTPLLQPEIHRYLAGILKKSGHHPIAIGGTDDHVHLLFSYNINQPIPALVGELKSATTKFIHENHLSTFRFEWQRGYGVFAYHRDQLHALSQYILNQPQHHKGMTLEEETRKILEILKIDHDCRYIFHNPE